MNLQQTALAYLNAGLSVIPTHDKRPDGKWQQFQARQMTEKEAAANFANAAQLAIICGKVSGSLEIIDVDCKYDITGKLFNRWKWLVQEACPTLWKKLCLESTKSGGYHVIYRCDTIEGNQKLARRPATDEEVGKHNATVEKKVTNNYDLPVVLIETRGDGGYFVAAPSEGYSLLQGSFDKLSTITPDERAVLFNAARSLNEWMPKASFVIKGEPETVLEGGISPGDDYDQRGDVVALLGSHGWVVVGEIGETVRFKRPGETTSAYSANYNQIPGRFWCWSTSTVFNAETPYKPYAVFAMLECDGDFKAAAKKLYGLGYGTRVEHKKKGESTTSNEGKDFATDKIFGPAKEFLDSYYNIRQNEITLFFEDSDNRLDEKQLNGIYIQLKQSGCKISFADFLKLVDSPFTPVYNPIKEFVERHHQKLGSVIGNIDKLIQCIYPLKPGYNDLFIKKWLVGMVATAYTDRANVLMLVLTGGINTGKTYLFEHLLPEELNAYYAPSKLDQGKDSDALMCNKLLILNDELDGMSNYEAKTFRNFISASRYTYRPPYGRQDITRKRLASVCGTSNETGIIADFENNRRIVPIRVDAIDHVLFNSIDKTQLLIEAYRLYLSGFKWDLTSDDIAALKAVSIDYKVATPESQLIPKYLKKAAVESVCKLMTASEILSYLADKTKIKLRLREVGMALREMGFKHKTKKIKGSNSTQQVYLVDEVTNQDALYEDDEEGTKVLPLPLGGSVNGVPF